MTIERIGYYCARLNQLKMFGPVIAAQRARRSGLDPLLIVPVPPLITYRAKNKRLATGLYLSEVRAQLGDDIRVAEVDSPEAFRRVLQTECVRAVVNEQLDLPDPLFRHTLIPSRRDGVKWCALGYLQQEFLHILRNGLGWLDHWDIVTTFSGSGVEYLASALKEQGIQDLSALHRIVPIGFVELDQVKHLQPESLRQKYGIPIGCPVVYFSTAPRFHLLPSQIMRQAFFSRLIGCACAGQSARLIWGRRWPEIDFLATYEGILKHLREFCQRNGALLIAKTRAKHQDPRYLKQYAHEVFDDGFYYPFRTLELMSLSDLYVGMASASSYEAAFIGKRMINIIPFPQELFEYPHFLPVKRELYLGKDGLWNAEGFSWGVRTFR